MQIKKKAEERNMTRNDDIVFTLDKPDVEKAIIQFVCANHPDVVNGYRIETDLDYPMKVEVTAKKEALV
jgi:hypothetical protein